MDKSSFAKSGICEEKVLEIINNSNDISGKEAYRVIKRHGKEVPMDKCDFMPTIMEYNKPSFTMPPYARQQNKQFTYFGMSVVDTYENAKVFRETVNSLRGKVLSYGIIDKEKGSIGCFEPNGHFQYFLYNPIDNNPVVDFQYIDEEEEE